MAVPSCLRRIVSPAALPAWGPAGAVLLTALLLGSAGPSPTAEDTVIALFVVREDHVAGDTVFEVLPLAVHEGGDYRRVTAWEVPGGSDVLHGDSILAARPEYVVFRHGARFGSLVVDHIVQEDFDCSELYVGRGPATFEAPERERLPANGAISRRGYKEGREIGYSVNMLLALDADAPAVATPGRAPTSSAVLSHERRSLLLEEAARRMSEQGAGVTLGGLDILSVAEADFDGDGRDEHVVVAGARRDVGAGWRTIVLAGRFREGTWQALVTRVHRNVEGAWGRGYRLLDVMDLNGDGVPEVVFQVGGYEATSYEIFEYDEDRLEEVFSHTVFGC